jgi:hypothetical protein
MSSDEENLGHEAVINVQLLRYDTKKPADSFGDIVQNRIPYALEKDIIQIPRFEALSFNDYNFALFNLVPDNPPGGSKKWDRNACEGRGDIEVEIFIQELMEVFYPKIGLSAEDIHTENLFKVSLLDEKV